MNSTFTVTRSEWCRGGTESALYQQINEKPERCCLGFYGNQLCGLTDAEMEDTGTPEATTDIHRDNLTAWGGLLDPGPDIIWRNTAVCKTIIAVNDRLDLTDEEREAELTVLFASIDVAVVFVD